MSTTQRQVTPRRSAQPMRKSDRLETRVTPEQKALVQRAASLQDRSLTDFVLTSVQQAAEQAIREHEVITLTAHDSRAVMDALLHPEPAGPWLRQPTERYKDVMGDQ